MNSYEKIVICTDSKSSATAITSRYQTTNPNQLVENIKTICQKIAEQSRLEIMWIPAHIGIPLNEQADKAAKIGHLSNNVIPNVPTKDMENHIKNTVRSKWTKHWENSCSFLRKIKKDTYSWSTSTQQNRKEEKILARLRTGHSKLTHDYVFRNKTPPQNVMYAKCHYQ